MYSLDYFEKHDHPMQSPDYAYERRCGGCEEKDQTLDYASEHLEVLVKQLYSTESLDLARVEDALDELCHLLQVKIHPGMLQIERKGKRSEIRNEARLEAWKSFAIANSKIA